MVLRQAACIVLMRPNREGTLEVYLVRRSEKLTFLGGFYAFPGGTVDPGDALIPVTGAPRESMFCSAALRELFEETGVLAVPDAPRLDGASRTTWRHTLETDPPAWGRILQTHGLHLDATHLIPMGRWVTPPFFPITFDAQYFGLLLPPGETPEIWPGELTDGVWVTAVEAMAQHHAGTMYISYPVLETLHGLRGARAEELPERAAVLEAKRDFPTLGGEMVNGLRCWPVRTFTLPPATHTNCYVLGDKNIVVVDPGSPLPDEQAVVDGVLDRLRAQGARLQGIWLTHYHHDHIGGAEHLRERYGMPVLAHEETARRVQDTLKVDTLIADNTVVSFEQNGYDAHWQALATPGHAQGHLCFYERSRGHLLSGDTILGVGSTLVAPRPEGSMGDYMQSLRRLLDLKLGLIFPGHGPPVAAATDKVQAYLRHRQAREEAIFATLTTPRTVPEIVKAVYTDVDPKMHALAETNVRAHLEKLLDEKRISAAADRYTQGGA